MTGLAGAVASTITCPIEVVKTQLQVRKGRRDEGMVIVTL